MHHKPSDYHGSVWIIGSEVNKTERLADNTLSEVQDDT